MSLPSIDWPAVRATAVRLALPRTPIGGRLGERLGAGTGSSLEFQDYRSYAPGDDLRHVDWAAYARSEVLAVRLYREEVAPRVDLVIDASRSMAVREEKRRAYAQLCGVFACACVASGAHTHLITAAGRDPVRLHRPEDVERVLTCDDTLSPSETGPLPLRRQSMRVVIGDFLFPHDPDVLVPQLARDGASLSMVQLTLREEANPGLLGGRRLVDVETRGERDLTIDARAARDYQARFARLRAGLSRAARRAGARFACVAAESPLREVARELAAAGILEPA